MSNFFSKELVESFMFSLNDLNGKTLEISVGSSVDSIAKEMITVVMGLDKTTGNIYVLHQDRKVCTHDYN